MTLDLYACLWVWHSSQLYARTKCNEVTRYKEKKDRLEKVRNIEEELISSHLNADRYLVNVQHFVRYWCFLMELLFEASTIYFLSIIWAL